MRTLLWMLFIVPLIFLLLYPAACKEIPECPHYWDVSTIEAPLFHHAELHSIQGDTLLSGPRAQTNVPEFNDCQQLVIGSGHDAQYTSLYAVFAHDSLDDPKHEIQLALESGKAFPMVEILSLGGTYPQLQLQDGFNCLFVYKEGDTWRARLVAFGSQEQDCHSPKRLDLVQDYPELSIKRTTPSMNRKDYPPVARWEWDVGSNTQVIGFMCLEGWCEVGELGHDPETGPDLTDKMNSIDALTGQPVLRIKGWYDEQRLSPATRHRWKFWEYWGPRSVVGTIVPAPGLDLLDSPNFDRTWQPTAYVDLSEPSDEYGAARRFVPMAGSRVTTISLCMEDWGGSDPLPTGRGCPEISKEDRQAAKCGAERQAATNPSEAAAPTVTSTIHWWARTDPAGDSPDPKYWCITRRIAPPGVPVPGTARWRWLADDETSWHRCGGACCTDH